MKERILVVDDEPGILSSLSRILADEGYRPLTAGSGREGLEAFERERPDLVLLDIWLPDRDGLDVLQAMRAQDPSASIVMMSGHGDVQTAVKSVKLGATDYLEKPLSYDRVVQVLKGALEGADDTEDPLASSRGSEPAQLDLLPLEELSLAVVGELPQRTIRDATVLYGHGLHSGTRTGMVLQPLPVDSGIHFLSLPAGVTIPARISHAADTEYATTLARSGETVRTVEHLMSALHARGITNLLVKVHGELPVLDGSALEFCRHIEQVGVEDQPEPRRELVVDRRHEVTRSGGAAISIEPADRLSIRYQLSYPAPVGEQTFEFELDSFESYVEQIAPARTFGFLKDLEMINELGLGSGGRLDNFILVGEDDVINTELRFPDEFVRHKILDVIGDLYLLGFPVRGRVDARLTGHRDNVALQRAILDSSDLKTD